MPESAHAPITSMYSISRPRSGSLPSVIADGGGVSSKGGGTTSRLIPCRSHNSHVRANSSASVSSFPFGGQAAMWSTPWRLTSCRFSGVGAQCWVPACILTGLRFVKSIAVEAVSAPWLQLAKAAAAVTVVTPKNFLRSSTKSSWSVKSIGNPAGVVRSPPDFNVSGSSVVVESLDRLRAWPTSTVLAGSDR